MRALSGMSGERPGCLASRKRGIGFGAQIVSGRLSLSGAQRPQSRLTLYAAIHVRPHGPSDMGHGHFENEEQITMGITNKRLSSKFAEWVDFPGHTHGHMGFRRMGRYMGMGNAKNMTLL